MWSGNCTNGSGAPRHRPLMSREPRGPDPCSEERPGIGIAMTKSSTRDVSIGKFDILATYTYAQTLLDGMPEDEAKQRGMVAAIMGAQMRLGTRTGRAHDDPFQAEKE